MKSILIGLTLTLSSIAFAAPTTMTVDTAASEVNWTGSKVIGASHNGHIKMSSGSVQMDGKKLLGGEFVIDMNSINNVDLAGSAKDKAKLEGHLKSDDFFGVAKHPTATFKITS
ncbi:MAG: YceI family protein, partial [Bdellovibrionota bacterium]